LTPEAVNAQTDSTKVNDRRYHRTRSTAVRTHQQ